jgi:hypothetical protein
VRVPTDSAAEELASSAYSAERKELKRRVRIVAIIAIVAIGVLAAVIGWNYLTGAPSTLHYRLTLKVDVDGQPHIGSGVIETRWGDQRYASSLAGGVAWHVFVKGEAVVIDLGQRGLMFATLDGRRDSRCNDPPSLVAVVLGKTSVGSMTPGLLRRISEYTSPTKVDVDCIPMLVRFGDPANPMTAQLVDPNDLSTAFGSGVKLVEATIAITDEQVTRGIESTLPWVTGLQGSIGKDDHLPYGHILNQLNDGSFRQGMNR